MIVQYGIFMTQKQCPGTGAQEVVPTTQFSKVGKNSLFLEII